MVLGGKAACTAPCPPYFDRWIRCYLLIADRAADSPHRSCCRRDCARPRRPRHPGSIRIVRSHNESSRESQSNDFAWQRLAELTDTFGPRLSGCEALERAIDWAVADEIGRARERPE